MGLPGQIRIIAGEFKGRRLRVPPGNVTRPMSDRGREALFNILAPRIPGISFLDLYAGTGAVGLEALSRGAKHVVLVESDGGVLRFLRGNVEHLGMEERVSVVEGEVVSVLKRGRLPDSPFDIVFAGPPYGLSPFSKVLEQLLRNELVAPDGLIILQRGPEDRLLRIPKQFVPADQRHYGKVILEFLINTPGAGEEAEPGPEEEGT